MYIHTSKTDNIRRIFTLHHYISEPNLKKHLLYATIHDEWEKCCFSWCAFTSESLYSSWKKLATLLSFALGACHFLNFCLSLSLFQCYSQCSHPRLIYNFPTHCHIIYIYIYTVSVYIKAMVIASDSVLYKRTHICCILRFYAYISNCCAS